MTLQVEWLRWHDPISVVGTPSRSECYGASLRLGAGPVASATRPTPPSDHPPGMGR